MFQRLCCIILLSFLLYGVVRGKLRDGKADMPSNRSKRSLVNLHTAMRCNLPNVNFFGSFARYGCYCGISGEGEPLDEIDRCCLGHDLCYDKAHAPTNSWESLVLHPFVHNYKVKCENATIICAKNSPYGDKLCTCDKEFGSCLRRTYPAFNPALYALDTSKYCKKGANTKELLKALTTTFIPATTAFTALHTQAKIFPANHSKLSESNEVAEDFTTFSTKSSQSNTQLDILPTKSSFSDNSADSTIRYRRDKHLQNQSVQATIKSGFLISTVASDVENISILQQNLSTYTSIKESVSEKTARHNHPENVAVSVFLHLKYKSYFCFIISCYILYV